MEKRLYRSKNKMISGVCSGIAEYLNIDPTIIRLVWAFLSICSAAFPGLLVYIICAIVIPQEDAVKKEKQYSDEEVYNMKKANISEE